MKIKDYRKLTGKTQKECARDLGITSVYFSDVERGKFPASRKLAQKLIKWSNGAITFQDLWENLHPSNL